MAFEKNSLLTTDDNAPNEEITREPELASAPVPVHVVPAERGPEPGDALFSGDEAQELRSRWQTVQTGFVDEPRKSVEEADRLVATAMKRLSEMFTEERSNLEAQWGRGSSVSTEDLRVALQRYRAFFTRLLSV